jgi:hypothetical protein
MTYDTLFSCAGSHAISGSIGKGRVFRLIEMVTGSWPESLKLRGITLSWCIHYSIIRMIHVSQSNCCRIISLSLASFTRFTWHRGHEDANW